MSLLTAIVAFLLVLGPLVFFHELGHFIFAKLGRIRVIEFGFGYPPRLLKFWQSAGRITVGGVRLTIPKNIKAPMSKADAQRLLIKPDKKDKSAGFGFLDQLSLPGDAMEMLSYPGTWFAEATFALQPDGSRVLQSIKPLDPATDNVESGAGAAFVRGQVSDLVPGTEYTLNWLPLGGFTRMLGEEDPTAPDSFAAAPKRWRAATLLAGPAMNVLLAFVLFVSMFMAGAPEPKDRSACITPSLPGYPPTVKPGAPADRAGLKPGDLILAINGQPMQSMNDVQQMTWANLGKELVLSIQRDQAKFEVKVTPRRADEFDRSKEGPLGINISNCTVEWQLRYFSLIEAAPLGLQETVGAMGSTVMAPVAVIRGLIPSSLARPVGPVGIAQLAGAGAEDSFRLGGLYPILRLAGFLSIAVGLTNLLPLPALDGGRLVFILVELIRRRRVDPKKETIVHLVGMALLLTLMVLITVQDILNPIMIPRAF